MRLILDAGALIAFDKGDPRVRARLAAARRVEAELVTTSPVIGQAWRDGRKQALLARLIASTRVEAPDETAAKQAGVLLARTNTSDVVDALLAGLVNNGDMVITSDAGDIERLLVARGVRASVVAV